MSGSDFAFGRQAVDERLDAASDFIATATKTRFPPPDGVADLHHPGHVTEHDQFLAVGVVVANVVGMTKFHYQDVIGPIDQWSRETLRPVLTYINADFGTDCHSTAVGWSAFDVQGARRTGLDGASTLSGIVPGDSLSHG